MAKREKILHEISAETEEKPPVARRAKVLHVISAEKLKDRLTCGQEGKGLACD